MCCEIQHATAVLMPPTDPSPDQQDKNKKKSTSLSQKKNQQRPENLEAAALCRCYNYAGMSELFLRAIS
jgi:hypothetical protein